MVSLHGLARTRVPFKSDILGQFSSAFPIHFFPEESSCVRSRTPPDLSSLPTPLYTTSVTKRLTRRPLLLHTYIRNTRITKRPSNSVLSPLRNWVGNVILSTRSCSFPLFHLYSVILLISTAICPLRPRQSPPVTSRALRVDLETPHFIFFVSLFCFRQNLFFKAISMCE